MRLLRARGESSDGVRTFVELGLEVEFSLSLLEAGGVSEVTGRPHLHHPEIFSCMPDQALQHVSI